MKAHYFFALLFAAPAFSFAQNNVGIGTNTPHASALLDVSSTTKGLLTPRMSTTQRNAIATPTKGLMVFDTDSNTFWYHNGTTWVNMATAGGGASSDWVTVGGNTYLSDLTSTVCIGTTNPRGPLTIQYPYGGPGLIIKSTSLNGYAAVDIDSDGGDAAIRFYNKGAGTWNVRSQPVTNNFQITELMGGGSRFVIENTTGNIGIGVLDPANILDVNGRIRIRHNGASSGIWMSNSTNGTTNADGAFYGLQNDNTAGIFFGNAWRFQFANNGNMTIGGTLTQNSDSRLKKDIQLLQSPLEKITALNGYTYYWIATDRDPGLQTGLLAQEVEKVLPELVKTDDKGMKSVNYIGLMPYMLEAIKMQQVTITTQQIQIEELKKMVDNFLKK